MFTKKRTFSGGNEVLTVSGLGAYSLKDTLECGQCFRYETITDTKDYCEYLFNASGLLIRVGQRTKGELIFYGLCEEDEDRVFKLFSLERDLDAIKNEIVSRTDSLWLKQAAEAGCGIAILSQDPFEALISFIISQNNNIPRIRGIIKTLASEYGVNLCLQNNKSAKCPLGKTNGTPCEEICKKCGACYSFPTAQDILARPEGLIPCRAGFRVKYILDACEKVASGEVNPYQIRSLCSYEKTKEALMAIKGVGEKVASCVALFGMENLEAFPIDVWMKRAIDTYFDGHLDHEALGRYAGIAQQYIFHYIRNAGE